MGTTITLSLPWEAWGTRGVHTRGHSGWVAILGGGARGGGLGLEFQLVPYLSFLLRFDSAIQERKQCHKEGKGNSINEAGPSDPSEAGFSRRRRCSVE